MREAGGGGKRLTAHGKGVEAQCGRAEVSLGVWAERRRRAEARARGRGIERLWAGRERVRVGVRVE